MKKPAKKKTISRRAPKPVVKKIAVKFLAPASSPQSNFNNIITASRMTAMMQCPRNHFWSYEIGLRKAEDSIALRIGSAWARAMEARWNGLDFDGALAAAVPEGCGFDEYQMATISGLLAAYYDVYGQAENFGKLNPEVQFRSDLGNGFTAQGVMDGLGSLHDGRSAIIESKTTSDSIAPDSDYWQRLSFNVQVYQYVVEARNLGWDVATCFYDVTRKPMIQPKQISELDADGKKIVVDSAGVRQFRKDGITPIEGGNAEKGWTIKSAVETPEQFCDRLYKDCLSRPDFYFVRREVPVIEQQVESLISHRKAIVGMIENFRQSQQSPFDAEAWPRNVSEHICDFCQFKTFCLQNLSVDVANPPQGFTIQLNPELKSAKPV